jgi:hypothetical protein
VSTDLAKILGAGFKDKEKLTSGVVRHLMLGSSGDDRRTGYLHPSAIAKENWCERQAYYDISGAPSEPAPRQLFMEMVFETGHQAHDKWQRWFWEMGDLRGMWRCVHCSLYWEDVSPWECPRCEEGRAALRYAEVPVFNGEFMIKGNSDGDVRALEGWKLIEVKTIGLGTIRWDAPQMLDQYAYTHIDEEGKSHRGVDVEALWRGIRRPFPNHIRQGMLYCLCAGRKEIVFIYDPKFVTGHPKEFEIKFRRDLIEDTLEKCLVVKDHLEKQRPPKRPVWAEKSHKACKDCAFRGTCYGR